MRLIKIFLHGHSSPNSCSLHVVSLFSSTRNRFLTLSRSWKRCQFELSDWNEITFEPKMNRLKIKRSISKLFQNFKNVPFLNFQFRIVSWTSFFSCFCPKLCSRLFQLLNRLIILFLLCLSIYRSILIAACERKSVILFEATNRRPIKILENVHDDCVNCVK